MQKPVSRILSALLVLVMVLSMLPATVLATEELTASLDKWNITLSDNIGVNFHITIPKAHVASTSAVMTVNEATITVPASQAAQVNGCYVFSLELAASQMTDNVSLSVVTDGETVFSGTYSVRQYADVILDGDYSEYDKEMVLQMLHYGAAAQKYFGYNTGNFANKDLEDSYVEGTIPSSVEDMKVESAVSGLQFYGASLVFDSKIAVRYYFNITGDVELYTFKVGETDYSPKYKENIGMYYVEVDGVNPYELDQQIVLDASAGEETLSVTYSPMNYVVRMSEKGSDSLKSLLKALCAYYDAAKRYKAYQDTLPLVDEDYYTFVARNAEYAPEMTLVEKDGRVWIKVVRTDIKQRGSFINLKNKNGKAVLLQPGTTVTMDVVFDRGSIADDFTMSMTGYGTNATLVDPISAHPGAGNTNGIPDSWWYGQVTKASTSNPDSNSEIKVLFADGESTAKTTFSMKIYEECYGISLHLGGGTEEQMSEVAFWIDNIQISADTDPVVSFELGYEGAENPEPSMMCVGDTYGDKVAAPTRDGYYFAGWYDNAEFTGDEIVESTVISRVDSHTLYARWIPLNTEEQLYIGISAGSWQDWNETQFANLKNANINLLTFVHRGQEDNSFFNMAYDNGIFVIPDDRDWADAKEVPSYKDHPAFLGYDVYDEPVYNTELFNQIASEKSVWQELMGDKYFYVTLCPGYGIEDFESYVSDFVEIVEPSVLAFDHYPLLKNYTVRPEYYSDLETMSYHAKQNNLPMWIWILSAGLDGYVTPTEKDMRWQMAMGQAYGAQALMHYTYNGPDYTDMIDSDGNTTEQYTAMATANGEVAAWADTYMHYDWQLAQLVAGSERSSLAQYDTCIRSYDAAASSSLAAVAATNDTVCGVFSDSEQKFAYMLTNATNPYNNTDSVVTLTFDEGYNYTEAVVIRKGVESIVSVANGVLTLTVESGEGIFVIPSDGERVVEFDLNGIDGTAPDAITFLAGQTYGSLPEIYSEYYEFGGWYRDAECTVKVEATDIVTENHTLYAKWSELTDDDSTLRFGNTTSDVEVLLVNRDDGRVWAKAIHPGTSGQKFWYMTSAVDETGLNLKAGSVITMDVIFERGNNTNVSAMSLTYGKSHGGYYWGSNIGVNETTDAQFTSYTFAEGETSYKTTVTIAVGQDSQHLIFYYGLSGAVTAGEELPAIYIDNVVICEPAIVTFNMNGVEGTAPEALEIAYGATYGTLPTVTSEGYTFDGWYKEASCINKADATESVTESHTLYAKWIPVDDEYDAEFRFGNTTAGLEVTLVERDDGRVWAKAIHPGTSGQKFWYMTSAVDETGLNLKAGSVITMDVIFERGNNADVSAMSLTYGKSHSGYYWGGNIGLNETTNAQLTSYTFAEGETSYKTTVTIAVGQDSQHLIFYYGLTGAVTAGEELPAIYIDNIWIAEPAETELPYTFETGSVPTALRKSPFHPALNLDVVRYNGSKQLEISTTVNAQRWLLLDGPFTANTYIEMDITAVNNTDTELTMGAALYQYSNTTHAPQNDSNVSSCYWVIPARGAQTRTVSFVITNDCETILINPAFGDHLNNVIYIDNIETIVPEIADGTIVMQNIKTNSAAMGLYADGLFKNCYITASANNAPVTGWTSDYYAPTSTHCIKLVRDGQVTSIGKQGWGVLLKLSATDYFFREEGDCLKTRPQNGDVLILEGTFTRTINGVLYTIYIPRTYIYVDTVNKVANVSSFVPEM